MKRFIVFFIIFIAAVALAATEPDKDSGQAEPQEKAQTSPETGQDSREELQGNGSWPRPFIPREKVGADSVVSFPADI